jgi:chemotaxis response regulator CheB
MPEDADTHELSNTSSHPWVIAIAGSAGGFQGLLTILSALPRELPAAILIVLHRTPRPGDGLVSVFARCTALPVRMAVAGDPVEAGVVYIARSDLHLSVLRMSTAAAFAFCDPRPIRCWSLQRRCSAAGSSPWC